MHIRSLLKKSHICVRMGNGHMSKSIQRKRDFDSSGRDPEYRSPSRPYELINLTRDLVLFARWILVPRGRLVFFLPTVSEDYDAVDVPVVKGMRELKWGEGSVQDFNKWGRRVSLKYSLLSNTIIAKDIAG